jgi:hypothetical protein
MGVSRGEVESMRNSHIAQNMAEPDEPITISRMVSKWGHNSACNVLAYIAETGHFTFRRGDRMYTLVREVEIG